MAIVEVSVVPIGTASPSVSQYVAEAERVLRGAEGINYELTAMGTIIEGELDVILSLVRQMHRVVLDTQGVMRVVTTVKIDERLDKKSSISGKVASVKSKLGN
jgi:uncharacterized protein (TIGR00106 family)